MKNFTKNKQQNNQKIILVIGAGAWGTAIANLIAKNNHQVFLSANKSEIINEINQKNSNHKYLPNIVLSKNITAISGFAPSSLAINNFDKINISAISQIFIATPSEKVVEIIEEISKYNFAKETSLVLCSKGLDKKNLKFFSEILSDNFNNNFAILSGPNFAYEVACEVATITTIASKNKKLANQIIKILQNDYFHPHYCDDVITTEISSIVKNIIAIGCGIIDGLNLGQNVKAALVKKGVDEILQLSKKLSGKQKISTAAGFGDIFLTCSSTKSRNNLLGFEIAKGKRYNQICKELNKTFEGATSVKSIVDLAKNHQLNLKLCNSIDEILTSSFSVKEIKEKIIKAILS